MSSLTSKSGAPQITNTTQSSAPPPYVEAAQQNLINTGSNLTNPFTSYAPANMTAGVNPDQQMAFDLARQSAYNAYFTPTNYADPLSPTANFVVPNVAQASNTTVAPAAQAANATVAPAAQAANTPVGPAAQAALAQMGQAAAAFTGDAQAAFQPGTSEQLSPGEIQQFLNPYLQNVLDPTLNNMRRQQDETLAQTRAKSAAAGAFGGSRGALMEAQQNRAFGEQVATTTAQLMAQGYDKATATAMANAQMRQQMALQNSQINNQVGMFNKQQVNQLDMYNAGLVNQDALANMNAANQVGMYNAGASNDLTKYQAGLNQQTALSNTGALNDLSKYQAGLDQQTALSNTGALNDLSKYQAGLSQQLGMYNTGQENQLAQAFGLNYNALLDSEANRNLTTAATNNTLMNSEQQRQLAALQQLLQTGDYQRQVEQSGISDPYTALQALVGSTPGMNAVGTTTNGATAAPTTSNPLASILGVSLLGKTLLSDEREKTDVQKLGKDPQTGVEMAAYRYKDDPKTYPKVIGPASAQQVERVMPGATANVGGKKVIKGSALRTLLGAAA